MKRKFAAAGVLAFALFTASCGIQPNVRPQVSRPTSWRGPQVWQNDIDAFVRKDRTDPPPANGVLFMGSSSVRMWDLKRYFPDLPAINRGFGGSYVSDSANYTDSIAAPYKPRLVVLYAGDNDLADGKPPQRVLSDFNYFLASLRSGLPGEPVVYVSIKPSPARWELWPLAQETNGLIKGACERQPPCTFLDVGPAMLGPDGKPRPELFQPDGLHLTDQGYRLWSDMLAPLIKAR